MLAPNGWTVLGLEAPAELQQLDLLALGAGGEGDRAGEREDA
jgi:hypothetical protein